MLISLAVNFCECGCFCKIVLHYWEIIFFPVFLKCRYIVKINGGLNIFLYWHSHLNTIIIHSKATLQGHKLQLCVVSKNSLKELVSMCSTHPKVCGILVPVHKIFKWNCAVGHKVIWRYCSIMEHRDPQTIALHPMSNHFT